MAFGKNVCAAAIISALATSMAVQADNDEKEDRSNDFGMLVEKPAIPRLSTGRSGHFSLLITAINSLHP